MKPRIAAIFIVAALITLGSMEQVLGWSSHSRWRTNSFTMRAGIGSFPSGGTRRAALSTVVTRFNKNASKVRITPRYNDSSLALGNGQSEVWVTSGSSAGNTAVCYTWYDSSGYIKETDVLISTRTSYSYNMVKTTLLPYGGSRRPFRTTAIHEFGHAAGLSHEDDEYNCMGQSWTHIHCNGNTAKCYLGEDANRGLVARYGRSTGTREDVSASMFEWIGRSGEYSRHNLCDVYSLGGSILSSSAHNGQRRYLVTRGREYKFEFTYENNGETSRRVRVGYYLSTNNTISTSDRLLETTWMTLAPNDVLTSKRTVRVPGNISSNRTYYIGVKVDDNNTLAEVDGGNNCAYHAIKTR